MNNYCKQHERVQLVRKRFIFHISILCRNVKHSAYMKVHNIPVIENEVDTLNGLSFLVVGEQPEPVKPALHIFTTVRFGTT